MRYAIISDLHSNIEALTVVLQRIEELKIDRIVCLGDLIGYGANPKEILDIAMDRFDITILGNHDEAVLTEPRYFNRIPRQAVKWTKKQLNGPENQKYIDFLNTLEPIHFKDEMVFTHGLYDNNINYVEETEDLFYIYEQMQDHQKVCFAGHSHQPCIWALEEDDLYYVDTAPGEEYVPSEDILKCWVNVGSVGQPRDKNNQSCFVVYNTDNRSITFERTAYDIDGCANKIREEEELDNFLADRLYRGI